MLYMKNVTNISLNVSYEHTQEDFKLTMTTARVSYSRREDVIIMMGQNIIKWYKNICHILKLDLRELE